MKKSKWDAINARRKQFRKHLKEYPDLQKAETERNRRRMEKDK